MEANVLVLERHARPPAATRSSMAAEKSPVAEKPEIKILAVEDNPLTADGLRLSLDEIDPGIGLVATQGMDEALGIISEDVDLSLIMVDLQIDKQKAFELIALVRQKFDHLPIVVFSADDNVGLVRSAFDAGVVGYISKRSTRAVLICALRLVLAGGRYVPPTVLDHLQNQRITASGYSGSRRPDQCNSRNFNLTDREEEVLSLLALGMSNKLISRKLAIAESTTKTHVSSIMRTLQVKNRTEVSAVMGKLM